MKYLNKDYKTIIWDWRSTVYDPNNETLYPWVGKFLKNNGIKNILVSWAGNPSKRKELIYSFNESKFFSKIYITGTHKREVFEEIFDQDGIDPDTTLIVGDNVNDEIAIAKDMGIDSALVDKLVKILDLQKVGNN